MRPVASFLVAALAALPAVVPRPAAAHPHVFIEADAALVFDEAGQLEAVRVTWTYDEFYSLMMIEDAGLDGDGDGTPDPARLTAFAGHDVDWDAGFPGHLLVEQQGRPLALGAPRDHRARFVNGRIVTSHLRPLAQPATVTADRPLQLRIYDPEYFVAYDTPRPPEVLGRGDCTLSRRQPDTSGQAELLAALQMLDMQTDSLQVMRMADVGVTFAERFEVACGAP